MSIPANLAVPIPRWKRTIDLTCCVIAMPFLLIAAILMWVALAVTSPGPIFFRQQRVGYLGRKFTLFKFRTMHVGADTSLHRNHVARLLQDNAPLRKMDAVGDKRLVPGGWLMRATGLDELPQLINVLRGDMSIVGPRPCIPYEYEQYSARDRARFHAVPGLTGLWQVSGKNRTTFEEMIRLDVHYSQTKSLALDLKIIAGTVPALCRQLLDTRRQRREPADAIANGSTVPNSSAVTLQT